MRLIDADLLLKNYEELLTHKVGRKIPIIPQDLTGLIKNAPTIRPGGDLISREDAIEAFNGANLYQYALPDKAATEILESLPSADAEPKVIRSKMLMPTKDFKEWAKRVREVNSNVIVIPCDAEVVSAEAVQADDRIEPNKIYCSPLIAENVGVVVRCKNCKWYGQIGCAIRIVDDSDKPKANDYCSFGERREP